MSYFIKHLKGLAKLQNNTGLKVGIETAANLIEKLQQRVADLERIKSEWEKMTYPVSDYVDSCGIGKLGECKFHSLIKSHQALVAQVCSFDLRENQLEKLRSERDALAAHVERFANLILSDRFPDETAQNELIWLVTRGKPKTSLIERDANLFEKAQIPENAKGACMGEFEFTVPNGVCPQCHINGHDEECEVCFGESNEHGECEKKVCVPWSLCKDIWKAMNKIKAKEIRNDKDGE